MTMAVKEMGHDRFVAEFESLARDRFSVQPERMKQLRKDAIIRFGELGFPTIRQEEWRFTNVAPIARTNYSLNPATDGLDTAVLSRYRYADCAQLVVSNGQMITDLSDLSGLPEGVTVCSLAEALERCPERVESFLGRYARFDEHPFVALNTALHRDGVFVHVPRGVIVERPINIVLTSSPNDESFAVFPRNLLIAEASSQVTVVEQFISAGPGSYLTAPVTEVVVEDNAVVDHYKLQRESVEASHIATFQIQLGRSSNFSSHSISWGGGLVRNDVNAVLDGEGGEATLNGLYMVEGKQLVDNHMRVDHVAPYCDSHELYKGILDGASRSVFNGRIYVHPEAQKTDAKQTNRNLLLSHDALCNSNPQLEIFADDVKCTHGSTIGQLDELGIFYLRSRGIGEEAARSLLTYAFAADIVERIKVDEVRHDLEEFLFRRLPKGDIVRQAV
jgi:Fe-S cluster assembly protein SufD